MAFTHPGPNRYRLPTYVSGARVVGNRLMVLLDLPQPEIVEMSLMGKELGRYQGQVPFTTMGYRGFDVQLSGSTYRFWLLAANLKKLAFMEFTGGPGRATTLRPVLTLTNTRLGQCSTKP